MPSSIIGRSAGGLAQVSNLALNRIEATVPRRTRPPSGVLEGLRAAVTVYQVGDSVADRIVPSTINVTGGGGDGDTESVSFDLEIPIEVAERDAAIRGYVAELARRAGASPDSRERAMAAQIAAVDPNAFARLFRQHRVGTFKVECRVLDSDRMLGRGEVLVEVLFRGRFFEQESFQKR